MSDLVNTREEPAWDMDRHGDFPRIQRPRERGDAGAAPVRQHVINRFPSLDPAKHRERENRLSLEMENRERPMMKLKIRGKDRRALREIAR